jgi:hypothetical protein
MPITMRAIPETTELRLVKKFIERPNDVLGDMPEEALMPPNPGCRRK